MQANVNGNRLMAVAPDLLAALRALTSIAIFPVRDCDQRQFDAAVALADAALARAKEALL